ncbi:hypothetical protein SY83_01215 [Paenibacillus swuensis]|uniref:Glyoxalase-like domain-containing protein n=1 Tax=Paenibacillus swuensis TaxID=1178515 RepID=A0A172TE56_9BACL|nr:VOC family protein [Paenibacillus swuensis]ANE45177.1 hypothetical protein SY83_01215 [Paenibacillus swuensis]
MSVQTISIRVDHVGIIGTDLARMTDTYKKLGFYTSPPSAMDAGVIGQSAPSWNTHYVFDRGYVELIASSGKDHLASYLDKYAGIHTLAVATTNAETSRTQLQEAKLDPQAVLHASRPAAHGELQGTASFRWFGFVQSSFPEGLVCYVEQLTPELIFQPKRHRHPNGANALAEVFIYVPAEQMDEVVRRYALLEKKEKNSAVGSSRPPFWCDKVTFLDEAGLQNRFPGEHIPKAARVIGMLLEVEDLNVVQQRLTANKVPHRQQDWDQHAEVWVDSASAEGCLIAFQASIQ